MAKVNIKSDKITPFGGIYYASKAFYALFMHFHLTKSSMALLVFAAPPTTATSGTRWCQPCLTCSSVAVTAWKMSTEASATCGNLQKSEYQRATQSGVP